MQFATLSTLLFALALGHTLAQDTGSGAHNSLTGDHSPQCGVPDVKDAILADCISLLDTDDLWAEATKEIDAPEGYGSPVKIACYEKCCLFHRWEKWSWRGFDVAQIRDEARPLINCASGGDDPQVNGRISYGKYDEMAEDDTRHGLCIGGNLKQGHNCWPDIIEKEAEEDKQRAKADARRRR